MPLLLPPPSRSPAPQFASSSATLSPLARCAGLRAPQPARQRGVRLPETPTAASSALLVFPRCWCCFCPIASCKPASGQQQSTIAINNSNNNNRPGLSLAFAARTRTLPRCSLPSSSCVRLDHPSCRLADRGALQKLSPHLRELAGSATVCRQRWGRGECAGDDVDVSSSFGSHPLHGIARLGAFFGLWEFHLLTNCDDRVCLLVCLPACPPACLPANQLLF